MRTVVGKLGFLHRRLWSQDPAYRMAFVIGPPSLLGILAAFAIWSALHSPDPAAVPDAVPWARYTPSVTSTPDAAPVASAPNSELPARTAGGWVGWTAGWDGAIQPITVSPSDDVDLMSEQLATYSSDGPDIDFDRIKAFGPSDGLYMGVNHASLAITAAGGYGISAEIIRDADGPADCLIRLAFVKGRLVSNLDLDVSRHFRHVFPPVRFDLKPGLYDIALAFGCWHGEHVVGPGEAFVLIRRPGQSVATRARADEILRRSTAE